MTRWIAVIGLVLSCQRGPSSSTVPNELLDGTTGAPAPAPAPAPRSSAPPGELGPANACVRFDRLAGEGCSWTQRFPPEFRDATTCVASLMKWFAPETHDHARFKRIVNCWALDCEAAAECIVSIQATAAPPPARTCGEEGTAPIHVDATAWSARRGATAKRFADVPTTIETPIEACGIQGELEWMTRVTCNDGSNPYKTLAVAHDSRDPWIGRGGRCNSILDRFSVRCPEATYPVYVDRYVCEQP